MATKKASESGSGGRKAFPLRLNHELYAEVRKWAEADFRSVNGQIEFLLRQAVRQRKRERDPSTD